MVNPAKILIIDDDAEIRNLLKSSLASQAHEFAFAKDGPEGLEKLQSGDFDVAILDLMLPEINGLEILRRVQGALPHTEIVVLTGYASLRTALEALRLGAYDYIAKPFPLDAVRSAVRRALEKQRMETQLAAIYELSREMTLLLDVEQVAEAMLEMVRQVLDYESCGLWLIDEEEDRVFPIATRALEPDAALSFPLDGERSIVAAVARTGEAIYAPDTSQDPRYVDLGSASRSELAVPLMIEGHPIGVLNVESKQVDAFSSNDERLLSTLAAQTAVAIQSARRYQQAQHEVAERERAEEALRGSEKRFRALVESSADHIFMLDPQGVYLASNDRVHVLGLADRESLVGATLEEIYPPDVAATYRQQLETVIETGESVEFEHPMAMPDGLHYHRDTLYPIWRDDEIWAVGGLCHDITPEKRAEEALRKSEARFRRLLSSSEDMIFSIDREGVFWMAGGKRLQSFGLQPEDVIGHSLHDLFGPDEADRYQERHEQVFETGEPITYEHTYEFEDVTATEMTTVYPVDNQEGEIELLGVICRDIADLKRTEAELRQRSAQMEALQEVALELATQLDLDVLLESIVNRAADLVGGTGGGIYAYRPEEDVLEWAMSIGSMETPIGTTLERGEGLSGTVWETGEPLAVADYQAWPGRAAAWAEFPSQAVVGIPIRWGEELLGVLNVRAEVGHVFAPSDIETLTLFAAHAAAALQNARSYHALEESEERYRATLDAMGDAIQVVDADLRFTLFNRRWREWGEELGWDRDVLGERLFDVITFLPDHVEEEYRRVFETGEVLDTEERIVVNGQEFITQTRKIPIFDGDEVAWVVTVVRDVTAQRKAQEARRASEKKYRTMIEQSLQGVLIIQDDRIVFANSALARTLGRPVEELTALSTEEVAQLVHPEDRFEVMVQIEERLESEGAAHPRYDFRIVRRDGEVRWLNATTSLIEYQGRPALQAFSIDITERKQAEKALQARAAQLEALREVGLDLTAQLDLDELLAAIVAHAVDLVDGIAGGLNLYRPEQDALDFVIHTGLESVPRGLLIQKGQGLSGRVWETGEAVIVDDYQSWNRGIKAWAQRIGNFADIGVPIWWGDEFLGVLEVMKEHPRTFSEEDAELLQLFAIEAAVAIHNAQLYEQAQREIAERQRAEAALQESEREKALILNTAQEMVAYYDTSLTIQWANRAAGKSVGLSPEELVGLHCYELWHQRDEPCQPCPVLKARETGEPQEAEMATPDGRIWFLRGYPIFDDQGELTALIEFGRDITARKQAELESQRRNEELAAIHKTGQALTSTLDLDQVLTQVLFETREILVAEAASVLLYDEATEELEFAAAVGTASDELVGARMPAAEGVAGWAMQHAEPVVVANAGEDPRFYNGIDEVTGLTTRSLLAVPLIAKGDVIGVLEAVKRSGEPFDHHDLRLATTLAGSAATAIENARLYEQTARRLAHTQTLREVMQATASTLDFDQVVERTIDAIHHVLDMEYLGLVLPDPSGEHLTVHPAQIGFGGEQDGRKLPVDGSVCGRAYTTGKSVRIDDVRQEPDYVPTVPELLSELAVPVPMEGEIVAVLNAESPRLGAFSEDDQQTLEAIAAQLGVALKNTQLYQAEQRRREVAEALRKTSRVVNSSLRQDEVLPRILDQLAQVVDYDSSSVLLNTGDQFQIVAARGFEDLSAVLGVTFAPQPGDLFSTVAQERRAMVVENVHQDPRWKSHQLDEDIHSWIGAPLLVRDEMIGVLAVHSCEPGAYTTEDGELVFTFASHVAVALENARLYEAEREQRQLLEQSQAQLVQSEKLAATGRLAASLAHEINNPLQAIHNGLQLLLTFPMNPDEQREYLQMADEEVERLMEMVARILDFARRPERRMELTQLNTVVEKVVALASKYLQHRHIVLEQDLAADLPPLLATPDELGQVFLNLIINALDAMPEGGTLRVTTRLAEDDRLAATFTDTGHGIKPEHIDRIFEPFFSTKKGGTGLGLSVSYNVVKRHGGDITVESTLGEGTTFTVWLPTSQKS